MSDEMEEIVTEFVTEAEETLDRIDPMFVELETKGYDKDLLNEIFRGMHTLKGAAGFLGFQPVVDVAHRAESIMKRLRDGEVALTREFIDVILKSVDALRLLIFHIKLKDGVEEDTSDLLKALDTMMEIATSGVSTEQVEIKVEEPGAEVEVREDVKEEILEAMEEPHSEHEPGPAPKPQPQPRPEEQVQQITKEKEVVSTLRVDVSRIDKAMDLAGEIVLARNRLINLASEAGYKLFRRSLC